MGQRLNGITLRRQITERLAHAPGVLTGYAIVASFSAYFCMYFYRKAFAAGTFADATVFGLEAKSAYIIAQVIGYAASKLLGIKVVSEIAPARRARGILYCIAGAEASLVLFGLLPPTPAAAAMVANGLSLGMVWGMVFGFLEGRQTSDLLGAGLCASFIVASGAAKWGGQTVLRAGVSERWMPATTGAIVAPAMLLSIFLLAQLPPPSREDQMVRTERVPMDGKARTAFFRSHGLGLVLLVGAYVLLTALRDFRDNFATDIWVALGYGNTPAILATSELPVAFAALLPVAAVGLFASNRAAVLAIHGVLVAGGVLIGAATLAYQAGAIGPVVWMISIGIGLYLAYVPYNCVLFDRLVAAGGSKANAGFLIYVADASGYAGSVVTVLYKSLGQKNLSWVRFLEAFGLVSSVVIVVAVVVAALYFWRTMPQR